MACVKCGQCRTPNCRLQLAFALFFGICLNYMMRVNVNITLLSMVNDTVTEAENYTAISVCEKSSNLSYGKKETSLGTFDWDRPTQGLILGAFFWGYLITQIPGGILSFRFGPKWVGFGSLLTCSVLELAIPFASFSGPYPLMAVRIGQGLAQGVIYPTVMCLLGRWIPPNERSRMTAFVNSGSQMGTIIGQSVAGILSQPRIVGSELVSHWPLVHYLIGSLGCLFLIFWFFVVYDDPSCHPRITNDERSYIREELLMRTSGSKMLPVTFSDSTDKPTDDTKSLQLLPKFGDQHPTTRVPQGIVPWRSVLRSRPFWAILIIHVTHNWSWYTLITCMPTYMSRVQGFSMADNGILSSLPYMCQCLFAQLVGFVSDMLIKRGKLTVTWARKINNLIALGGIGAGLLTVGLLNCNRIGVVLVFVICIGMMGAASSGFTCNIVDLAPQFAGVILSITNTMGTLPGILGPLFVGYVTQHSSSLENWRIVFGVATGIAWFGALINLLMTSAVRQPWGELERSNNENH
ncbi:putative inorganic phosphate cotransporter [Paragonimus heterotremus]|uniref:Putative inorganic phosphate cotransporter n=1 Tax=Paragonimus heterotremus TaxID=100268 RepID=A0A8J4WJG6_9TREM|nr:putative inorganic phosphate cotransporter [Paragonimus heterotremus]